MTTICADLDIAQEHRDPSGKQDSAAWACNEFEPKEEKEGDE